jgi:hypothetical protein
MFQFFFNKKTDVFNESFVIVHYNNIHPTVNLMQSARIQNKFIKNTNSNLQ